MVTVVITTTLAPYGQAVQKIEDFDRDEDALAFINAEARKWWDAYNGGEFSPIAELGYDKGCWELWGERGFHALLDEASEQRLHEEHYKREYDDRGIERPGYLQMAAHRRITRTY
jgi:hypothetical protein